jgi:hypothetical protein
MMNAFGDEMIDRQQHVCGVQRMHEVATMPSTCLRKPIFRF